VPAPAGRAQATKQSRKMKRQVPSEPAARERKRPIDKTAGNVHARPHKRVWRGSVQLGNLEGEAPSGTERASVHTHLCTWAQECEGARGVAELRWVLCARRINQSGDVANCLQRATMSAMVVSSAARATLVTAAAASGGGPAWARQREPAPSAG